MKKEKLFCAWHSLEYEKTTTLELEKSKLALQSVLDIWNSLNLVPCTDIRLLILNPQKAYSDAINTLAEPPVQNGPFQVSKRAYIESLDLPIPDQLYQVAKLARQQAFCAVPDLWSVKDGNVIMNTDEAEKFINSQNLYVEGENIEIVQNIGHFVHMFNEINAWRNGELLQPVAVARQLFAGKFDIKETENGKYELSMNPEALKRWLKV